MAYKELDRNEIIKKIDEILSDIKRQYENGKVVINKPAIRRNRHVYLDGGVTKFDGATTKVTTDNIRGLMYLIRLVNTLKISRELLKNNKTMTVRDLYYTSSNWDEDSFTSQSSVRMFLSDIEVILGVPHEAFGFTTEESKKSTRIIGNIILKYNDITIDYSKIGMYGSGIPVPFIEIDNCDFDVDVDYALVIESEGIYRRLAEDEYYKRNNCLLIHTSGQPSRACRRVIKKLNEVYGIPIYIFTDGDPYGWRIFATIKYGSISMSHVSDLLATPSAEYIGITTDDIIKYKLPGEKLTKNERKDLMSLLSDKRFSNDWWKKQINGMLKIGRTAEQQSLFKYGLNFVEKYLSDKLSC